MSEFIPYVKSFSIGFWFNIGSRDENPENNGIAHFIEHMVFKGTKKRSSKKISEEIESCGGYLNAFTSKEHTCFYGRGLAQHFEKTFDVLSDMVQNPMFKQEHIVKEAGVILDELRDINDNPEELVFDEFEKHLFEMNGLGLPIIGKEKNVLSFNSDSIRNYYKKKYFSSLTIVCSGAIKHNEVLQLAEKYLLKGYLPCKNERSSSVENIVKHSMLEKDFQQVHIILGRKAYGYKEKERIPFNLLTNILGEGSSSRLFQAIREKLGITYQINTFINSYFDISTFGVYFSTGEKQSEKVLSILSKEFKKLQTTKVSEKELKRVKEYLKGSMLLSLENTTNRMIRIANSLLYFNRIIPVEEIIRDVEKVTPEEIHQLAKEMLNEKDFSKIEIRSKKKIQKAAA
ncbi:MAG: insulinase family protein [Ignavibacteriaceae bacterium]|nr:insulinase family protein [Ignavibacteriaceae bacterium]